MTMLNNMMMVFGTVFCLLALPFVVEHVQETWDAEEYPYSGFCTDAPVHYENSLPPVQEMKSADACSFGVTRGGVR